MALSYWGRLLKTLSGGKETLLYHSPYLRPTLFALKWWKHGHGFPLASLVGKLPPTNPVPVALIFVSFCFISFPCSQVCIVEQMTKNLGGDPHSPPPEPPFALTSRRQWLLQNSYCCHWTFWLHMHWEPRVVKGRREKKSKEKEQRRGKEGKEGKETQKASRWGFGSAWDETLLILHSWYLLTPGSGDCSMIMPAHSWDHNKNKTRNLWAGLLSPNSLVRFKNIPDVAVTFYSNCIFCFCLSGITHVSSVHVALLSGMLFSPSSSFLWTISTFKTLFKPPLPLWRPPVPRFCQRSTGAVLVLRHHTAATGLWAGVPHFRCEVFKEL